MKTKLNRYTFAAITLIPFALLITQCKNKSKENAPTPASVPKTRDALPVFDKIAGQSSIEVPSDVKNIIVLSHSLSYITLDFGSSREPASLVSETANAAFANDEFTSTINAGNMTANDSLIEWDDQQKIYGFQGKHQRLNLDKQALIKFEGSAMVPAFAALVSEPFADSAKFINYKPEYSRTQPLVINLGSPISNGDSVSVSLSDYNNKIVFQKQLLNSETTITFSSTDLMAFAANTQASIQFHSTKTHFPETGIRKSCVIAMRLEWYDITLK